MDKIIADGINITKEKPVYYYTHGTEIYLAPEEEQRLDRIAEALEEIARTLKWVR